WRRQVTHALTSLGKGQLTKAEREHLARAVVKLAGGHTGVVHLPGDLQLAALGLEYAPHAQSLQELQKRLKHKQKTLQSRLQKQTVQAEVKTRIESVRRAAAANDIDKATRALARIKDIDPDTPFLR